MRHSSERSCTKTGRVRKHIAKDATARTGGHAAARGGWIGADPMLAAVAPACMTDEVGEADSHELRAVASALVHLGTPTPMGAVAEHSSAMDKDCVGHVFQIDNPILEARDVHRGRELRGLDQHPNVCILNRQHWLLGILPSPSYLKDLGQRRVPEQIASSRGVRRVPVLGVHAVRNRPLRL